MNRHRRRRFLSPLPAAAAGVLLALAGCADRQGTAPAAGDASPTRNSTPITSSSPTPTARATDLGTFNPDAVQSLPPAPSATTARIRGAAPSPDAVNRRSFRAVGEAFLRLAYTYDTTVDFTPADAGRRAAALASPRLATALRRAAPAAAPGAQWQKWLAHRGYTTVSLSENLDDGRPPDTPAELVRSWRVTISPVGEAGWQGLPQEVVAYLALTNSRHDGTGTWSVSDLRAAQ